MFSKRRGGFSPTPMNNYRSSLSFDLSRPKRSVWRVMGRFLFIVCSLMVLASLVLFGVSSCQTNSAAEQVLSFTANNKCEFRFEGEGLTLIENHCGSSAGIYFMTPEGLLTAPLIEPAVSELLDKHGCNAPNRCQFNVKTGDTSVRGQFDYLINGVEGFYTFEWPRDALPRLVDSSSAP